MKCHSKLISFQEKIEKVLIRTSTRTEIHDKTCLTLTLFSEATAGNEISPIVHAREGSFNLRYLHFKSYFHISQVPQILKIKKSVSEAVRSTICTINDHTENSVRCTVLWCNG